MNFFATIQRKILDALQPNSRRHTYGHGHVYEGTANPKAVAKRRSRNKVARRSRAINRHR